MPETTAYYENIVRQSRRALEVIADERAALNRREAMYEAELEAAWTALRERGIVQVDAEADR